MAQNLNMSNRGTGITLEQQVSPRHGREQTTYHLVPMKITSFLSEIQSECFKYFYMKNRKYINSFLIELLQIYEKKYLW
ncbi:hypothetical protein ASC72_10040 [Flavobacterium sp. Root420]|nr:hypothetical protein ASC72_10040 [Flavobacterium sp. Root420]